MYVCLFCQLQAINSNYIFDYMIFIPPNIFNVLGIYCRDQKLLRYVESESFLSVLYLGRIFPTPAMQINK